MASSQVVNSSPQNENGGTTIYSGDNAPDNEGGKYQVAEVYKFQLPAGKDYDLKIEFLGSNQHHASWAIDGMLIDEELLYAEDKEADKIYQELKARSFRRRNM